MQHIITQRQHAIFYICARCFIGLDIPGIILVDGKVKYHLNIMQLRY